MSELIISEEMLLRRYGDNTTRLAALARRAVDWAEKHGDSKTLASAIMVLMREDVVMRAMFGDDGADGRVMTRRALARSERSQNGRSQTESRPATRKKSASSSTR